MKKGTVKNAEIKLKKYDNEVSSLFLQLLSV